MNCYDTLNNNYILHTNTLLSLFSIKFCAYCCKISTVCCTIVTIPNKNVSLADMHIFDWLLTHFGFCGTATVIQSTVTHKFSLKNLTLIVFEVCVSWQLQSRYKCEMDTHCHWILLLMLTPSWISKSVKGNVTNLWFHTIHLILMSFTRI